MGRKSLASERRPQVISAAHRVIAKRGLAGATQELIAEEAGVSRAHVRHYVGNRKDLINLVWVSTMGRYIDALDSSVAEVLERGDFNRMLDFLFGPDFAHTEDQAVIEAYFNQAKKDAKLQERIAETYVDLARKVSHAVQGRISSDLELVVERGFICLDLSGNGLLEYPRDSVL